jgi:hypothetical protein
VVASAHSVALERTTDQSIRPPHPLCAFAFALALSSPLSTRGLVKCWSLPSLECSLHAIIADRVVYRSLAQTSERTKCSTAPWPPFPRSSRSTSVTVATERARQVCCCPECLSDPRQGCVYVCARARHTLSAQYSLTVVVFMPYTSYHCTVCCMSLYLHDPFCACSFL